MLFDAIQEEDEIHVNPLGDMAYDTQTDIANISSSAADDITSLEMKRKIADAELQFLRDVEHATCGNDLMNASFLLGEADKKLCSLTMNKIKKVLTAKKKLDDSFMKGGYGGMAKKERSLFLGVLCAVDQSTLAELKMILSLPPSARPNELLYPQGNKKRKSDCKIYRNFSVPDADGNHLKVAKTESEVISSRMDMDDVGVGADRIGDVTIKPETDVAGITQASLAVNQANVELLRQKTLSVKAQRLAEAMRDDSYNKLNKDDQEKIRSAYVEAILGH